MQISLSPSPTTVLNLAPEAREADKRRPPDRPDPHAAAAAPSDSAERQQLSELKRSDREVRSHEQAHKAVAGPLAHGGPVYVYQTGSDGRRYAIAGHVSIDTSAVPNDPAATLRKANTVRRAALAPSQPSAQDRRVAAEAAQLAIQAQQDLAQATGEGPSLDIYV